MSYLLDTCVLSQLRKSISPKVRDWFNSIDQDLFYLSVVTIAELLDGIERLTISKKKKDLEDWFYGDVYTRFKSRILNIDDHIAKEWCYMNSAMLRKGYTMGIQDLYIAATAKTEGFAIVTLNIKDFEQTGIPLFNPWSDL